MALRREASAAIERRRRPRVALAIPIRLRWPGPFRQTLEVRSTRDISRGGALVESSWAHSPGSMVWAAFPFDAWLPDGFPEMPGRIVRAACTDQGTQVAIEFEAPLRNGRDGRPPENERRSCPRRRVSVPVRIRAGHAPWHEEAMTEDISAQGLLLFSTRLYEPGQGVRISLLNRCIPGPWAGASEVAARITRVEPLPGSSQVALGLCLVG